jgi:SHS2 domain-containing protein
MGAKRAPGRRKPKFRQLFHTTDLALQIFGDSLEEIYENAGAALTATMVDRRYLRRRESREISLAAPDREALLVEWLNRLLYLFDVEGFLGREFRVTELGPEKMTVDARGDIYDPERHPGGTAIKAATYHRLEIAQKNSGWQAKVILDL